MKRSLLIGLKVLCWQVMLIYHALLLYQWLYLTFKDEIPLLFSCYRHVGSLPSHDTTFEVYTLITDISQSSSSIS